MSEDLCYTCKFGDWIHGELWGCTHATLEECDDCKVCDPEEKGLTEDQDGRVIRCCMYEETPEEIDEGRPYDKYRDNPRFRDE